MALLVRTSNNKRWKAAMMDRLETILEKIETWDLEKIREAIQEAKQEGLINDIETLYRPVLEGGKLGKTLRSLANLPDKFEKMSVPRRHAVARSWPKDRPFVVEVLDLSGKVSVDAWRYRSYSDQVDIDGKIGRLRGVKELILDNQQLETLPEDLFDLRDLEVLSLADNDLRSLPTTLLQLKNLRVLNVRENYQLSDLPDIGELTRLEELDLTSTSVDALPESFFELEHIKRIFVKETPLDQNTTIMRRVLSAFPNATIITDARWAIKTEEESDEGKYRGQETISIDNANINTLPNALFAADKVSTLVINGWSIKKLPDRFDELSTLTSLAIHVGPQCKEIPPSIGKIPHLQHLEIRASEVSDLPDSLANLKELTSLYLSYYRSHQLPKALFGMTALKSLHIQDLHFSVIPDDFARLVDLSDLNLEAVTAESVLEIASGVRNMNLTKVSLKLRSGQVGQGLYNLPPSTRSLTVIQDESDDTEAAPDPISLSRLINRLPNLVSLKIEGVALWDDGTRLEPNSVLERLSIRGPCSLPDDIGNLTELKELDLRKSDMESFPPSLYECRKLTGLSMSHVRFRTLPEGIEQLTELRELGFQHSPIESLPDGIFQLTNLRKLVLGPDGLYRNQSFKAKLKRKIKGVKVAKEWY